jgi:energy-coupling factor transport system substrate-specific component
LSGVRVYTVRIGTVRVVSTPMRLNMGTVILAAAGIALNVALGTAVFLLKLPIYLDSIGIMVVAILVPGTRHAAFATSALVAILSFAIGGLLVNPFLPWFTGTGIAGAAYAAYVVRGRVGALIIGRSDSPYFIGLVLFFGIIWGFIAAIVSAPIVVYLFGGVTGSGTTLILAFLVKAGQQLINAAILTGFAAEPIDKTLQFICAIFIARSTPTSFRERLYRA